MSRVVGHCRKCQELDNEARSRDDRTTYRSMLRDLCKTEESMMDNSHIIFLMQVRLIPHVFILKSWPCSLCD